MSYAQNQQNNCHCKQIQCQTVKLTNYWYHVNVSSEHLVQIHLY